MKKIAQANLSDMSRCEMMRFLPIFFAFLALFSGCSKEDTDQQNHGNTLRITILDDPQSLDPRQVRDLSTVTVMHMLYEGLMRVDTNGEIIPGIAENVEISRDLKTYTFRLRDSRWSDGEPITANDFERTWKSILDPQSPAPNGYQLYVIKGAKEAKEGKLTLDKVGIIAEDSKTLVVRLKAPTPYFLELTASHFFYPVNRTMRNNTSQDIVTNGPFRLTHWNHHDELVAEKNPEYWDVDSVNLDQIQLMVLDENTALQMFEMGQLDWAGSPMSTIPQDAIQPLREKGKLQITPAAATHWFRFNTNKTPFNHPKMRRAFNLALDRQAIVDHITQGNQVPAIGIVPPSFGFQNQLYYHDADVEKARQLFQEALWEIKLKRNELPTITLCYAYNDRNHKVAQAVQQQWNEAFDIEVSLENCEDKTFFEKISTHDYQIGIGSWYANIRDPINFLDVFKYKNNKTNYTEWENPRYIALLDFSQLQNDLEKRKMFLEKAEELLIKETPVAPLFHGSFNYLKKENIHNVYFSDLGYLDFKHARID